MLNLGKGQSMNLDKAGAQHGFQSNQLTAVTFGLGWNPNRQMFAGQDFDLDAQALVTASPFAPSPVISPEHHVFYNRRTSPEYAVQTRGDDRTGDGGGDDEQVLVNLAGLPPHAQGVYVIIDIHDALNRGQRFGHVSNAYLRVIGTQAGGRQVELMRYDLDASFQNDTTVLAGGLGRSGNSWDFQAIGHGFQQGIVPVLNAFGLH